MASVFWLCATPCISIIFFTDEENPATRAENDRKCGREATPNAYLEILVRHGLILGVHGLGRGSGELADNSEDDASDAEAQHGVPEHLFTLAGRWEGAGPVRAEGYPVCWVREEISVQ